MVIKKDIYDIIEYVFKNYDWKNHESDFTSYSYTTLSGREVTIKVLKLTQKQTFIKKEKEQLRMDKEIIKMSKPLDKLFLNNA